MSDEKIERRQFLVKAGMATTLAGGALVGAPAEPAVAQGAKAPPASATPPSPLEPPGYLTLTDAEAAFLSAVADTMIPADNLTPSGTDCGIVVYADRQLAGAWGGGAKLYRAGPFVGDAKPEQGYQLPLTPRQLFAVGIAAVNRWSRTTKGHDFDRLPADQRAAALTELETGKAELDGVSPKLFFEALLDIVMEGMFADPIYGGNRDKVGWKLVGFPGLPAVYNHLIVKYRDQPYVVEPKSIADFS
jgi:gluconate 2-dehydrogenase gamma chain